MRLRKWLDKRIRGIGYEQKTEDELKEVVTEDDVEEVFELGITEKELAEAINQLRDDAISLKSKVRRQMEMYKKCLEESEHAQGIEKDDLETDAQTHLNLARDLYSEYEEVKAKFQIGKSIMGQWDRQKRKAERREKYGFSLSDWNVEQMDSELEEVNEQEQQEVHAANRIQRSLNIESGQLKPDKSDVKKDVDELERDRLKSVQNNSWSKWRREKEEKQEEESDEKTTLEEEFQELS